MSGHFDIRTFGLDHDTWPCLIIWTRRVSVRLSEVRLSGWSKCGTGFFSTVRYRYRYWVPAPNLLIQVPVPQYRKYSVLVPKMASTKWNFYSILRFWSKITLFCSKISLFWSKISLFWSKITLFWLLQYRSVPVLVLGTSTKTSGLPVSKLFWYRYWKWQAPKGNSQNIEDFPQYCIFLIWI